MVVTLILLSQHRNNDFTASPSDQRLCACAGDDAIAIHGRMHMVAAVLQSANMLTLGNTNIDPSQLNTGDTISAYSVSGQLYGTATVASIAATTAPLPSTTPNPVFGGDLSGYYYYKACTNAPHPCTSGDSGV